MTEVWIADEHDLPALVDMGERFHAASRLPGKYNGADFGAYCADMIEREDAIIYRSDAGMIGGHITNPAWDASYRFATEAFWWAEDGAGAALLDAFEAWGREHAHEVRMFFLSWIKPLAVARVLSMRGYVAEEMGMSKWLQQQ